MNFRLLRLRATTAGGELSQNQGPPFYTLALRNPEMIGTTPKSQLLVVGSPVEEFGPSEKLASVPLRLPSPKIWYSLGTHNGPPNPKPAVLGVATCTAGP